MTALNVVRTNALKSVLKCAKRTNALIRIAAKIAQLKDAKVRLAKVLMPHVVQLPMNAQKNVLKRNVPQLVK